MTETTRCIFCSAPGTQRYLLAQRSVAICAPCLARQELEDAYEGALPELHDLTVAGQFGQAQHLLDEMLSQHGHRDADGWLARSVVAHKALLYAEQGDHGRAIAAYERLKQLGFVQPSQRVEYSMGISRALLAAERASEAVTALEETLGSMDASILPSGVTLFEALVASYAAQGKPIPEHWRDVLRSAAVAAGVEIPRDQQDLPLDQLVAFAAEVLSTRSEKTV